MYTDRSHNGQRTALLESQWNVKSGFELDFMEEKGAAKRVVIKLAPGFVYSLMVRPVPPMRHSCLSWRSIQHSKPALILLKCAPLACGGWGYTRYSASGPIEHSAQLPTQHKTHTHTYIRNVRDDSHDIVRINRFQCHWSVEGAFVCVWCSPKAPPHRVLHICMRPSNSPSKDQTRGEGPSLTTTSRHHATYN